MGRVGRSCLALSPLRRCVWRRSVVLVEPGACRQRGRGRRAIQPVQRDQLRLVRGVGPGLVTGRRSIRGVASGRERHAGPEPESAAVAPALWRVHCLSDRRGRPRLARPLGGRVRWGALSVRRVGWGMAKLEGLRAARRTGDLGDFCPAADLRRSAAGASGGLAGVARQPPVPCRGSLRPGGCSQTPTRGRRHRGLRCRPAPGRCDRGGGGAVVAASRTGRGASGVPGLAPRLVVGPVRGVGERLAVRGCRPRRRARRRVGRHRPNRGSGGSARASRRGARRGAGAWHLWRAGGVADYLAAVFRATLAGVPRS